MRSKREETQRRRRKLHEELRAFGFERVMRGTLVERLRRCGREGCACARDPQARHPERYVSIKVKGRTVALHLRLEDEPRVRRALKAYQRLWKLIEELTECEVADLRREARERARSRKRRRG
jgi:hypothetical protein